VLHPARGNIFPDKSISQEKTQNKNTFFDINSCDNTNDTNNPSTNNHTINTADSRKHTIEDVDEYSGYNADQNAQERQDSKSVDNIRYTSFEDMQLKEAILRGIYAYGYETPSVIQQNAIVPTCSGRDIIAQSQSGTGKTAAFSVPILQRVDESNPKCQAIVLTPTRELAHQTKRCILAIGSYMKISCHAVVGGTSVRDMIEELRRGVQVVVGTPGRILDMLGRKALDLFSVKILILDEADEMLSFGFRDNIADVIRYLPINSQIGIFSATLSSEALEMTDRFMKDPLRILIQREQISLDGIKQFYIDVVDERYKLDTLCDLYDTLSVSQSVIFVNMRRKAEWLQREMTCRDFTVSTLHSDMPQAARDLVMTEFRSGSSRVLIATDILARGIDVQQVSLIINYDLPRSRDNYIHRIGRSGRFGRKGFAINFIAGPHDFHAQGELESYYHTQIISLPENFVQ